MISFSEYLIEAKKKTHALDFGTGSGADSAGKLFELLVGKHLQGTGSHMQHYRVEGKTPKEIHDTLVKKTFGEQGENHPGYQLLNNHSIDMANKLREHFGLQDNDPRVVWTSQPGDHEKETGVHDPNSKADLIINRQHAISAKFGSSDKPNYFNPGMENFEQMAGHSLQHHQDDHAALVRSFGLSSGPKGHAKYKELRDSTEPHERENAERVRQSAEERNKKIAADVRTGLSKRTDEQLRSLIRGTVNAPTHLPTTVAHTILNPDGTASHHIHPIDQHVNSYLSQFSGLHVDPDDKSGSVTIHGYYNNPGHKDHGKKMAVWSTPVYSGGRPTGSARGAVKLNSESNKTIRAGMEAVSQPQPAPQQQKQMPMQIAAQRMAAAAPQRVVRTKPAAPAPQPVAQPEPDEQRFNDEGGGAAIGSRPAREFYGNDGSHGGYDFRGRD